MSGPHYATPTGDHAAWRESRSAPGCLPMDIVAFVQGGVAPILGARSAEGRPLVGSAAACRVQQMRLVRVFLDRARNAALLEAVAAGSAIAATFSRARDHRSIQLKASCAVVAEAESADLPEIARQCTILREELEALGYTRAQAIAYTAFDPADLAVVAFTAERAFTQTPGPGAGAELRR